jgi:DNA invertase Pin-like site-specific DNA recombinase
MELQDLEGGCLMNVAYIRVSTTDQNTGRQFESLKNCNIDRYFEEKLSGKDTNRPQLQEMLKFVREGDTVYIESISRLARNTLDFLRIVEHLTALKAELVSLKENIDTSTPSGRFMLSVFAALAQMERDTIKQRQREGIDLAKAENRYNGRPRIETSNEFPDIYARWKAGAFTAVEAMKLLGLKKNTFYNRVKEYEKRAK